ncbi:MAG: hypothetical protein FD180_2777 [Planctomycetota bacterium]|nr:MAG: hypothetical protein FD180_2777 [Planctomycetota bacterium]
MKSLILAFCFAATASADPEVMGQILDSDGKDGGVIEFAILRLKNPEDLDGTPIPVKSERSGRFYIKLAPGAYRLGDIRKPLERDKKLYEANYARDLIEVGDGAGFDIGMIKLEKTGTYVAGTVKRSGKPVAGVAVEVFDPGAGYATGVKATTDAAGRYEMQMNEVKGPQSLVLTVVEKDGQAFARGAVDLWKPATADVELPEKYVEVMVDLTAPEECWVYFHPKGDPSPYAVHKMRPGAKASIPSFAPGAWTITAVCPGAQTDVEAAIPAAAPIAIALPAGPRHRVDGKVTVSGAPKDFDWSKVAVIAKPDSSRSPGYLFASVSRDGSFAFPGLASGKYELSVATGKRIDAMRWFSVSRSAVAMGVFELVAPRTVELSVRAADLAK